MKTLKEYIIEGIFDIEDNIGDLSVESLIEDFIKENYEVDKKLQIKKKVDKYIVSTNGDVIVTNKNITALTNGLFEWGEVNSFYCRNCISLKDLKGAPKKVDGYFNCSHCTSLESLEGAPEKVGRSFYCLGCISLKDLKGAPKEIKYDFSCIDCTSLKSLKGAPKEVGFFSCRGCTSLKSLKGAPEKAHIFNCVDCGKKFTKEDVRAVCDVEDEIYV